MFSKKPIKMIILDGQVLLFKSDNGVIIGARGNWATLKKEMQEKLIAYDEILVTQKCGVPHGRTSKGNTNVMG